MNGFLKLELILMSSSENADGVIFGLVLNVWRFDKFLLEFLLYIYFSFQSFIAFKSSFFLMEIAHKLLISLTT